MKYWVLMYHRARKTRKNAFFARIPCFLAQNHTFKVAKKTRKKKQGKRPKPRKKKTRKNACMGGHAERERETMH